MTPHEGPSERLPDPAPGCEPPPPPPARGRGRAAGLEDCPGRCVPEACGASTRGRCGETGPA